MEPTHLLINNVGEDITITPIAIAPGATIAPGKNTSVLATNYVTTIAEYVTHLLKTLSPEEAKVALQGSPIELVEGLASFTGAAIADDTNLGGS